MCFTPSFQFSSSFFCWCWNRNPSVAFSPKHITSDSSSSHQTLEGPEESSNRKIGFISSLHTQGIFPLLSSYFTTLIPDPYGNVGIVRVKCCYFRFTEKENKVQRERERATGQQIHSKTSALISLPHQHSLTTQVFGTADGQ